MASYVQRALDSIPEFKQRYEKFLRLLRIRQYAEGTIQNYCSKIACVCLFYGKVPEEIEKEEINRYLSSLLERKPLPAASMFIHVSAGFRCYYSLMGFKEKKFSLPSFKKKKTLSVVLSYEEMRNLLRTTKDYRSKLILALLYSLGLRVGELCRLEVRDLDLDRQGMHIRQGKGGKDRYLPLAKNSIQLIKCYLRDFRPQNYLFYHVIPSTPVVPAKVSRILKEACIRIDCRKKVTCHTLRHTFATHSLEMGVSIFRIKDLLGHAHLQSTLVYLQVLFKENEVSFNPLDKLFPPEK